MSVWTAFGCGVLVGAFGMFVGGMAMVTPLLRQVRKITGKY